MFTKEFIGVLIYLTPGLLSIVIFNYLVLRDKPSSLQFIVETFLFTTLSHLFNSFFGECSNQFILFSFAIIFPIIIAKIHKWGKINDLLVRLRITSKSDKLNTWVDVFSKGKDVQITFKDNDRILVGQPTLVSENHEEGLIFLEKAAWMDENGKEKSMGAYGILVNYKDVDLITLRNYIE